MPKKMNRKELQEYIPAGHGDASGEYANEGGSSKHFSNWQNPNKIQITEKVDKIDYKGLRQYLRDKIANDKTKPATIRLDEAIKLEHTPDEELAKYNDEYIKSLNAKKHNFEHKTQQDLNDAIFKCIGKHTPNGKKLVKNIEESNANPRYISIMANLYTNGKYEFTLGKNVNARFQRDSLWNNRTVFLGNDSLNEDANYLKGETFFHESGHALDYTYRISEYTYGMYSRDYVSKKHNMTLQESVNDELSIFKDENKFNEVKKEVDDYYNRLDNEIKNGLQEYKKAQELVNSYDGEIDSLISKAQTEKFGYDKHETGKKLINGEISFEQYKKISEEMREINEKVRNDYKANHLDYKELYDKYNETYNNVAKLEHERGGGTFKKYGDLSDMVQAVTGKQFYGGHDATYFNTDTKRKQATECFAELTSASAVNKESYNVLKKYIPRTIEIYEEIIGEIENGK